MNTILTYENLEQGIKTLEKSYYEPSVKGFLINLNNSWQNKIITDKQKEKFLVRINNLTK